MNKIHSISIEKYMKMQVKLNEPIFRHLKIKWTADNNCLIMTEVKSKPIMKVVLAIGKSVKKNW